MKKFLVLIMAITLAGCAIGGSVNAGGGSNGVGVGFGLGTGIRF
ncbi:hypothetical protein [Otariodibacter oris]|uniref:Lipoprotein n=1 Tax=Otariodibacter oris TaxID=1032623 RepID=A0A420XID8_9PAST|nr:hypothetical protein [Otariodibacter oris]RKR76993.1 hypothetical protein DES31_0307 [Otariodibacter oris]